MQSLRRKTYEIILGEGYVTLRIMGDVEEQPGSAFEVEVHDLATASGGHVVVNCAYQSAISPAWARILVGLARKLREKDRQMRLVCLSPEASALLQEQGMSETLKTAPGLRDALQQIGFAPRDVIDTEMITPFLDATTRVLLVQAATVARSGALSSKEQAQCSGDISGVVGMVGDSFSGTVVISFPEPTFLMIMSRMMGESFAGLTEELADGAAELMNIIFGWAKAALNKKGYGIKAAVPSVVTGRNHFVHTRVDGPVVVVPFETDVGSFFVEICASQGGDAGQYRSDN